MTFIHLGRRGYQITLWAATWAGRKKWLEKIEGRQSELRERSLVFETKALSAGYFVGTNRVTCAAPFGQCLFFGDLARQPVWADAWRFTDNGNRMVYGTDNGVYLSDLRDNARVPVKVISVPNVTQLDVLEEHGILVVLAGSPFLAKTPSRELTFTVFGFRQSRANLLRRQPRPRGRHRRRQAGAQDLVARDLLQGWAVPRSNPRLRRKVGNGLEYDQDPRTHYARPE